MKFHFKRTSLTLMEYPSKKDLAKIARDIYCKMFFKDDSLIGEAETEPIRSQPAVEDVLETQSKKSRLEEYRDLIDTPDVSKEQKKTSPSFSSKSEVLKCIKQEMAVFENLGERPKTLEMLFKTLMTIPASSVESERAF